uniref:NADH-ubiquinone oxidoreductase chain 5 n=1 Tax=Muda kuroiwae TaxID=2170272 RepID=A0A344ALV0_9HEMI|nr:NADH dehydrogenase subunit 5 [Muda kuroiwae]
MKNNKLELYFSMFLMLSSIFMLIMSMYMIMYDYKMMMEWNILYINSCNIYMTIIFDFMSTMFLSTVMFISSIVIMYSGQYMEMEKNINRFIYIVMMFVISMILLIISPNMISIIMGWDGLGLVSYCLVVYYQNLSSNNAGMLTALMNRVGDVAILLTIAWMMNFGSWNFMCFINKLIMNNMIMLIIIAGFTSSAQIPFSSWLPAAMAAPTPVSALVHSSTLVTAGVYLMIRFSTIIIKFEYIQVFIMMSIMTTMMSSINAIYEFDLKKIIALSTLSQLGIMMTILMMGYYELSFFHLIIHAMFKASLFLCAGVLIHNLNNNQDIRMMGSLSYQMPLVTTMMNIANLSLCGMPFMSGFYSKDLIMESMCFDNMNPIMIVMMYMSIGMTSYYSARLTYFSMNINYNYYKFSSLNETINSMSNGIIVLTLYSVLSGSMYSWLIFKNSMIIMLPMMGKMMTLLFSMLGIWMGYELSKMSTINMSMLNGFLSSMWFMSQIMTYHNQIYIMNYSILFSKSIDSGWGEYFGPQGIPMLMKLNMFLNIKMNENNFKIHIITFFIWLILMI